MRLEIGNRQISRIIRYSTCFSPRFCHQMGWFAMRCRSKILSPPPETRYRLRRSRAGPATEHHLSSILFGDTMVHYGTQYRVRFYPPFGYNIFYKNIILLGKDTTHLSRESFMRGQQMVSPKGLLPTNQGPFWYPSLFYNFENKPTWWVEHFAVQRGRATAGDSSS